jgi:hypothetical protein
VTAPGNSTVADRRLRTTSAPSGRTYRMSDDVTGDLGAPQPGRGLGARTGPLTGPLVAWYLPTGILTRRSLRLFGRTLRLVHHVALATRPSPSRSDAVFAARTVGIGATETSSVPGTSPPGAADPRVHPHASRTVGPGDPRHGVTGAVTSSTRAGPARHRAARGDPGVARTGAVQEPHLRLRGWSMPSRTATCEDRSRPEGTCLGLMRRCTYDLLVGWYLWVVAIVLVLALIALGAILVQRRRRSGGVLSVRPRPKKERQ